jgi:hypothetical protein
VAGVGEADVGQGGDELLGDVGEGGVEVGADRRPHQLRSHGNGGRRAVGVLVHQVADAGGVDVAGEDDRVLHPAGAHLLEQAGASCGVPVPLVPVVERAAGQRHRGHHDLVGEHVPRGP